MISIARDDMAYAWDMGTNVRFGLILTCIVAVLNLSVTSEHLDKKEGGGIPV
jgi:hypothetical protein